ncbi:putative Ig domain-containing protein [Okeanomitos corallinicola TIOX110]|uniref:Ig domain-containing protein n=1 Tax=Okeanomitos corallinicola TIOX110 TaxID=3133117 RepID=A0ABZ2ULM9_9CYAN
MLDSAINNQDLAVFATGLFTTPYNGEAYGLSSEILNPFTNIHNTSAILSLGNELIPPLTDSSLEQKIIDADYLIREKFSNFINNPDAHDLLSIPYGVGEQITLATSLLQTQINEGFKNVEISIIDAEILGNANGAYAESLNTIFLADEFVKNNSTEIIAEVLTEEFGHFIDAQINEIDSAGDEGRIFAKLVFNQSFSPEELNSLKAEDDLGVIYYNNQFIKIEKSELEIINDIGETLVINEDTTLVFQWTQREAKYNNEVGIIVFDNPTGDIDGVSPQDVGYFQKVLTSGKSEVIFSKGNSAGNWQEIDLKTGDYVGFYLIQNASTSEYLNNPNSINIFSSITAANTDNFDHVISTSLGEGVYRFNWEDLTGGGDKDFNDVVFNVFEKGFNPGYSNNQIVPLTVEFVSNEASYKNEIGFYYVDDINGTINGISPNDSNYAREVFKQANYQVIFGEGNYNGVQEYNLTGDQYIGWYLISNNTSERFLQTNANNNPNGEVLAYFSYAEANPDKLNHLIHYSNNQMGWEDVLGLGDKDYNDLVFNFNFGNSRDINIINVTVDDVSLTELDDENNFAEFKVSLSEPHLNPITIDYTTEDDTAISGEDYQAVTGSLTFLPGEIEKTILVEVFGDENEESDEVFNLKLTNVTNAVIVDGEATATIINDDDETINQPIISASLTNDTGVSDSDRITLDPTISGQTTNATSLQGSLNGNGFVDISDALNPDGSFTISLEQYEVLSNGALPSGDYTLELKAGNASIQDSEVVTVNFTLDRIAPPLSFTLAPESDTDVIGDNITSAYTVNLVGQTDPALEVILVETQQTVTADENGDFTFTDVNMPSVGEVPFTMVVVDEVGNQGRAQELLTREGINGAPEITSSPNLIFNTENQATYTYQVEATDPDGDELTYTLLNAPLGADVDGDGFLSFSPLTDLQPSYDFTVEVSDSRGGTDVQTFTVEVPNFIENRPPTFTSTPIIESNIGEEYSYQAIATDPDGDSLTFSLIESPEGLSIEVGTGLLLWNPTGNQLGDNLVTIQASDEGGLTDIQSFTITIEDRPTNGAPIFISEPITDFAVAVPNAATGDVNPELISLSLSDGEMATEAVSITLPGGGVSTGGQADIVFVVDESGSMSGEHEWLTDMVLELDAALQDRGITDNRYSLIGYTNQTRLFNLAAQTQVSVYGPGNQLVGSGSFESVINESELVFDLLADGTYTVVVNPLGTAVPFEYELNGTVIDIPAVALTNFNTPFTGTVAPQAEETFTFDAPAGSQILLDGLGSIASNDIRARLVDPNGDNVFSFARLNQDSSPYLLSEAGTYSLIVSGRNAGGDFSFQLLDFNSAATKIAPDTEIIGTIATGLETKVFQFDANKGQQIYFDSAVSQNIRAAIYAPDNQLLGSSFALRDFSAVVPNDGTYTLILRSDSENAVDYNFRLVTPEIEQTTLTIGEVVTGSLSEAGEKDVYLIEGTAGQRIWFDGLASDSFNIDVRITSPTGQTLINNLDANRDSGMLTLPETGTYSIVVNGDDFTGDYSFRVLDEDNANSLTLDTNFTSTIEPGSGTEIYTLEGTSGQELLFGMIAVDNRFRGSWALYGAASNDFIARNTFLDDFSAVLPADGTYTLVVDGESSNPINYTFNISDITTPTNITSSGFDTIRTGTLTTSDQEDIFTFDATAGTRIVFDGLTSASFNINARLTAPDGTALFSNQRLNNDFGQLTLPESGTYSIAVNTRGDLGDYSFRVLNLDDAKTLPLDSVFNGTLNVGQGIDVYEFTGSKGQRLFFDGISATGSGNWQLYSPENLELAQSRLDRDFTATLAADGIYKILFDGENQTPFDFSVQVATPQTQVSTLAIGDIVSGTLAEPGEQDIYQFNGVVGQQFWFDGLESAASEIEVALVNPFGERIFERVRLNQDSDTPFTLFESGEYSLIVNSGRGNPGSVTGDYSFQVLEITPNLTLPNNITGTFNLPNESQVFQFEGIKGQKFTTNPTEGTFGAATQASNATSFLSTAQGGVEDGYLGIDTALGLPFRDGAATNIILVTDEDRDIVNLELTFESIFNKLDSQDALLNVTINGFFLDGNGSSALGVDSQGIAYIADGVGGFITIPGGAFDANNSFSAIKADYVDLAWDSAGAAWDLNQLREGGDTAVSFTKAFVNVKAEEISNQLAVDILVADPNITVENLTGPLFGVNPGETASFDTKITGDGLARDFELFFVRPDTGFVLGSIPVSINQNYLYLAQAVDPDGDPITYSLLNAPTGASIDSTTGRIDWTPPTTGIYQFEIAVADNRGAETTQSFEVEVVAAGGDNTAPSITSTAPDTVRVGSNLEYQVTATDAESDPLTYFLAEAPEGVTIASNTGLVSWTPTESQTGEQTITVKVVDGRGGSDNQSFTLTVNENQKPVFTSNPLLTGNPNQIYEYDVDASDPEGTAITYSLRNGAPDGMTIDPDTGVIQWTPTAEQQGQFPITVFANDAEGERAVQSFLLNVGNPGGGGTGGGTGGTDSETPIVSLGFNSSVIEIGEDLNLQVRAVDDQGITSLELLVDGSPVTLNPGDITNGTVNQAVVNFNQSGLVDIVAIANDADGNVGTQTLSVRVIDPTDTTAPITEIDLTQFQENGTLINIPTDIIGTISDDNLEFYRLEIAPVNLIDLNNPGAADPDYRVLAEGHTNIENGVIGQVDPRFLANDSYHLRVVTQDFSGNISIQGFGVSINGEIKPGRFTQEFVDLSVPLAGLPIEVSRVYDSLQSNQIGDFGYGWNLGVQDARITESVPVTDPNGLSLFTSTPFQVGSTVTLTNPEGRRVTFTFDPVITGNSLIGTVWSPRFVAEPGVFDKLEVENTPLSIRSDGTAGLFLFGLPYNPSEYRLTTKDGTTYNYGQFDGLIDITDRNGNTLTYSDSGIVSSTGESIEFLRDSEGRITEIIDTAGESIKYDYNANGDLVSVTDRTNNTTELVYEQPQLPHYLTEVVDPLGRSGIRNEYNEQGQLIRIIDADGNALDLNFDTAVSSQTVTDPLGNDTTLVFDGRGNVVQEVDAEGGITINTYDDNNNLTSVTDPRGNTTTFTYDDRGNLLTETDALGNINAFTYNDLNQVLTTTDAKGNVTTNRYDSRGNLIEREDAAGNVTNYSYDALGNLETVTDAAGNFTNYSYDSLGRLTEVEDAIGAIVRFTYDDTGNIKTFTTPLGNTTAFDYSAEGQLVKVTDAKGNITQIEYNAAGDRTAVIDALGRRTEFIYNNRGLQTQIRYADGTVSETVYDALDRVVQEIDQNGNATEFEYDGVARLISVVDALGNKTQYGYDASGNQITQTDALGRTTEFEYDALNRLIATELPLGQTETFTYDVIDNLTSFTNFNGEIITYEYDPNNMLSAVRLPDADDEIYTYTPTGEVSTITDARGTTQYEYDSLDQLVRRTNPDGVTIAYTYNLEGNINTLTTPTGTVNYTYDALGLLETVTGRQNNVTTYSYDLVGNLIETEFANGIVETRQYDLLNRPILIENINSEGNIISSYEYNLDNVGNRLVLEENTGRRIEYSYDDLYRLTQATVTDTTNGNETTNYVYDNVGNRLSRTSTNDGTTTYTYDENERLLTQTNDGIVTNYSYDDAGNLITTATNGEIQVTYTWNSKGELSKAVINQDGTEQTIEYQYNTDGIRVASTIDGETTNFLIDTTQPEFAQVIEEYNAGNTDVTYTHGLDLISQQRNGETYFYHTDALGSTQIITDNVGNIANAYIYNPYGSISQQTEIVQNSYKYTGEQFDPELQSYYLRARYYNPSTGRFVSRDPFAGFTERPLSLNKYTYTEGNPINAIDPSGEVAVLIYPSLLTSPANQAAFFTITALQTFGSANLLFIGNVLEGANDGNSRADNFLQVALSKTKTQLDKIEKAVKIIAKGTPKPLGRAIKKGFDLGEDIGIEYISSKIGLS